MIKSIDTAFDGPVGICNGSSRPTEQILGPSTDAIGGLILGYISLYAKPPELPSQQVERLVPSKISSWFDTMS